MKLDATDLRYITSDEFRVLTAVEMGSKNHEVVPTPLIVQISGLRNGGVNKLIGQLSKRNLVARVQNAKYDGYRLTYGGYDYLAMRAFSKRESMFSVGNQIGVGKESDIYIVADAEGNEMVLKLHRLGRISFRAIKEKRDYLGKRKSASWMYMSRLAAQKEWAFMKVLHEHGFPVPRPIDQARHCILMEFQDAYPLRQISDIDDPGKLYSDLMDIIVRFARSGLIHGDYNEFNIMIKRETGDPIVIDFPQMVSTSHANAEWYFNRDVECIRTFFKRRFRYESTLYPRFRSTLKEDSPEGEGYRLDIVVSASGFKKNESKILDDYMALVKHEGNSSDNSDNYSEEEDSEEKECVQLDSNHEESEHGGIPTHTVEAWPPHPAEPASLPDKSSHDQTIISGESSQLKIRTIDDSSDEKDEDALSELSPETRDLSRSPPRSRSVSPESLAKMTEMMNISETSQLGGVRDIVTSDLAKQRARQKQKHHTKSSAQRVGRAKGSKAKQDTRVKLDKSGFWD